MADFTNDVNLDKPSDNLSNNQIQNSFDAFKNEFNQISPEAQLSAIKQMNNSDSQSDANARNAADKTLPQLSFTNGDSAQMFQAENVGKPAEYGKAFQPMDGSKVNSNQASDMQKGNNSAPSEQLPSLTLVDTSALAKTIDKNGYFVGGQENQLRSRVGKAAADSALNDALMIHAGSMTGDSTPEDSHPAVHTIAA